jgi:hypothetical protein
MTDTSGVRTFVAGEIEKIDGGDGLEGGHAGNALDGRANLVHQFDDFLPRDLVSVHLDTLSERVQVG